MSGKCPEAPLSEDGKNHVGKCRGAKMEIKLLTEREMKAFAERLLKVLDAYTTEEDADYDGFLKTTSENRSSLSADYPLYQQTQACFAINKLIEREAKILRKSGYSDGRRCAADYQEIEIKRGVFETLMVTGKIFFDYKGMKCIASLFFRGNYAEANFLYSKEHKQTMKRFQAALRRFMLENNYFKGEKLEFLPYSRLEFLKFPSFRWKDLILKKELRDEIDLNLLFPIKNPVLCKTHKIPWRRGVLLAGVPGTGKTQLGRVLCNELEGVTVIWATCKAVHDVSRVRDLFSVARDFAPTLIVMEDLDFYGQDREFITNPIVGELLNQLDGSEPNDGVFVLATTNRPQLLDRALADRPSRFDVKLIFEAPGIEERAAMIQLFSEGKSFEFDKAFLAGITDGLTGSHIREVINYASLLSLKEKGNTVISKEHIEKALKRVKAKIEKEGPMLVS